MGWLEKRGRKRDRRLRKDLQGTRKKEEKGFSRGEKRRRKAMGEGGANRSEKRRSKVEHPISGFFIGVYG